MGAEAGIEVKVILQPRRVRISPREKREEYVARLEELISFCEGILNNPEAYEELQLEAARVIIQAIRMSYSIVREVDVENLEQLAEKIKKALEESHREG